MTAYGIDPSLTGTGIAWINDDGTIGCRTIVTKPVKGLEAKWARLQSIAAAATGGENVPGSPFEQDHVAIEGPASIRGAGQMWDRAGLWWLIVGSLIDWQDRLTPGVIPPTVVKKWATGKGNSDKAAVAVAITKLLPDADPQNDNEADALVLAHMAAVRAGMDVPRRSWQTDELLAKGEWPEEDQ